ncbi:TetR family transcriptional regulator [Amycolatopsis mediterranei S699]|uniref:TetR family transcriptional regulator n=2 Tax=Amycolatopsis mediterranei TaxID=33910 RepID=A0A0H3DJU7_AMYMU|nr:TetR/AcrR family transcriptional regulator [Amycolatopsis mediterranei]ADJ49964.1 TetR family transcriptional regulator [Amycolatopsis mediterranei U32]AEK46957.1 TetR family transcriptional regulator [Amycolatopsis mediterranei S699]AFO81672.1 TetR family transcriptional regulator [Amycolatopsis mediterranei S699]AGT88801.1 TetR family transcriptional regulator [Amycolatopsis mediterranei RB]KDO07788.1 TetR family transcriptional regulator [Amycolatopsis mediterranei]
MPGDGRIARGDATRRLVLRRAVDVASVDGLAGLSLGRLATELELSKSGVFALFGSKEELQLATIDAALAIFRSHVVTPARAEAPGLPRLRAVCERWLDYSERRVFPGGCFFCNVGAEFDARPGRVHDAVAAASGSFAAFLRESAAEAVALGHVDTDAEVLAFELHALGRAANADAVLGGDAKPYDLARRAIRARLAASAR